MDEGHGPVLVLQLLKLKSDIILSRPHTYCPSRRGTYEAQNWLLLPKNVIIDFLKYFE